MFHSPPCCQLGYYESLGGNINIFFGFYREIRQCWPRMSQDQKFYYWTKITLNCFADIENAIPNVHSHEDWWEQNSFFLLSQVKIQKQAWFWICGHKTRKQNIVVEAKFSYYFNFPNKLFSCKYKLLRIQDNFTGDFIQYCFKIGNVTRPEILVLWLSQNWIYKRLYWPEQFVLVIMKFLEDFCSK